MQKVKKQQLRSDKRGAATLPTIIALSVLIIAMSTSLASTSIVENFINHGFMQSSKALFYAEAGAKDALMRIARNKNYSCDTPVSGCYEINFVSQGCSSNDGCARITVSTSSSPKIIISEGRVKDNIRKIKVEASFDVSANGKIEDINWQEIAD